uniref:Cytochrome P450 n=1 Tax=Salvator merianae TaxID=96440 RepID=A0A8D0DTV1_SALMN
MSFWAAALFAFLALLLTSVLGGLYTIGVFRKRAPNEPPLDKGFIPWLGYGMNFKKNSTEFLKRMWKRHGDIFTVLVGGNYLHFVMDPCTYRQIMRESKEKIDFNTFGSIIVLNAFGFPTTDIHHKIVQIASNKYLSGKNLTALNQVMIEKLKTVFIQRQGSGEEKKSWQQDGLFRFSYKTIFQASFLSLFGMDPEKRVEGKENPKNYLTQCEELYEAFQKFDRLFPQMALGMLDSIGKEKSNKLKNYFWDILSIKNISQKYEVSRWVTELVQQMADVGMTEKMQTQFLLLLLWASQANTGPAAFWILAYLLKHPEALKAVKEEVEKALRETGQEVKPGGLSINVSLHTMKTPLLDSAVEETLRLTAGSIVFRSVMQDTDLKMADGKEYTLRKGDRLLLFPFVALHTNPEIYSDPHTFKYDRFLNPDGTKKEFYKNGKKLKYYTLPFGGGTTMCPGRFFAVNEMKMFVIMMLTCFEMELVNAEEELPPVNESRYGLGIAQPEPCWIRPWPI